jgi:hypothetical protein
VWLPLKSLRSLGLIAVEGREADSQGDIKAHAADSRVPDSSISRRIEKKSRGMSVVKRDRRSSQRGGWSGLRVGLATCRYMIAHAVATPSVPALQSLSLQPPWPSAVG